MYVHGFANDPERLKPGPTDEVITRAAVSRFAEIAQSMCGRGLDPFVVERFLGRVVFILFAQSVGLLEDRLCERLLLNSRKNPEVFIRMISGLFQKMTTGGFFGADKIRRFEGDLFTDAEVLTPTVQELEETFKAGRLDWRAIDPSAFGTLFESGFDLEKLLALNLERAGGP
jgi:hypothetical protein